MIVTEEQRREAHAFYKEALQLLHQSGSQFMLGGAFAMFEHTGIYRDTKDLDVFCKPSEYPKILKFFADQGFETQLTDVRWLAKIFKGEYFIDIIFDTVNNICTVDDSWYEHATRGEFVGEKVLLLAPEELIFCKIRASRSIAWARRSRRQSELRFFSRWRGRSRTRACGRRWSMR